MSFERFAGFVPPASEMPLKARVVTTVERRRKRRRRKASARAPRRSIERAKGGGARSRARKEDPKREFQGRRISADP